MCVLADGRLASGSSDRTIRVWDVASGAEAARLEIDAPVGCLVSIGTGLFVAGDALGRLHWLETID